MYLIFVIVTSLAIGITNMLLYRRCGEAFPIPLSRGLGQILLLTIIHICLLWIGNIIGDLLRYESIDEQYALDTNRWIAAGLLIAIIINIMTPYLRRTHQPPIFRLTSFKSVMAMSVATGINIFLIGIDFGFAFGKLNAHYIIWPMLIINTSLSLIGLMLGRQKIVIRPRRWAAIAFVLLVGLVIAIIVKK